MAEDTVGDPPEPPEDLGDAGKKALDAERARARNEEKARKASEKRAADLEAELAKFREQNQSEQEKALAAARKEAEEATRAEITTTMNRRIVRAEVKAVAGGLLADPEDAVRLLDLDEFSVDEDGNVDADVVKKALDGLLQTKPYLAANGQRPQGSADGGPRPDTTPVDDSPRSLIAAGLAANEKARART